MRSPMESNGLPNSAHTHTDHSVTRPRRVAGFVAHHASARDERALHVRVSHIQYISYTWRHEFIIACFVYCLRRRRPTTSIALPSPPKNTKYAAVLILCVVYRSTHKRARFFVLFAVMRIHTGFIVKVKCALDGSSAHVLNTHVRVWGCLCVFELNNKYVINSRLLRESVCVFFLVEYAN